MASDRFHIGGSIITPKSDAIAFIDRPFLIFRANVLALFDAFSSSEDDIFSRISMIGAEVFLIRRFVVIVQSLCKACMVRFIFEFSPLDSKSTFIGEKNNSVPAQ